MCREAFSLVAPACAVLLLGAAVFAIALLTQRGPR